MENGKSGSDDDDDGGGGPSPCYAMHRWWVRGEC